MYEIRHYLTLDQRGIFDEWLRSLKDSTAKVSVVRRLNRAEQGNFAITSFAGMAFGSCGSTWAPAIGCITASRIGRSFCCYAVAISARRALTLTVLARIGKTGNGGLTNERPTPR